LLPSVLSKLARTWTWFWSRESLGSPKTKTPADPGYSTDTLRHLFFSRDYLGNGGTESVRPGRSLMRHILSSEDLPEPEANPPTSGPEPSILGWLFSREHLPRAGGAAPEPDSYPNPES
jgi:hypothetical protein